MVRLNKITKSEGVECEIIAKCEFFLPGGSLKDRIAKRMLKDAELKGLITPGKTTIIEASSGNTGIGLALNGAVNGYNVIITLSEEMSQEKIDTLNALGAQIIRTPTESFDDEDSNIGVARQLREDTPDSIILDQYCNPGNSLVHYDETAEEIWEQCEGKIDYLVLAAGTGGTISGLSRNLKEKNPNIQIVGVDPYGSILAQPEELNSEGMFNYKVEGIGDDFIPKVCDRTNIDKWFKIRDKEAFIMARRLIKEEGLLVGGSSGGAMHAAIQIAKELPKDKRVVVIFVDSVRNYMTKFLNDDWMLENGFTEQEEYDKKYFNEDIYGKGHSIKELALEKVNTVNSEDNVRYVLEEFKKQNTECVRINL
jgi:cystathionine beta-synthase